MHLATQRFLAARRGDRVWEAGCDYGAWAVERLALRLRPSALGARLSQAGHDAQASGPQTVARQRVPPFERPQRIRPTYEQAETDRLQRNRRRATRGGN
jgi:hypothetical protein